MLAIEDIKGTAADDMRKQNEAKKNELIRLCELVDSDGLSASYGYFGRHRDFEVRILRRVKNGDMHPDCERLLHIGFRLGEDFGQRDYERCIKALTALIEKEPLIEAAISRGPGN